MRGGDRLRAALIAAGLLATTLAHADYKDNYARGLKAYRDGNLAEARELIKQALGEHAEPATKIRLYGQVYEPYLPQHYLGLIAFKQGDCTSALAQWNSSANRGIVGEMSDIAGEQQRDSASCAQKGVVAKKEEKPVETPAPPPVKPIDIPQKPVVKNTPPASPPPVQKPVVPVEKPPLVAKNEPPQPLVQAFDDYLAGHYADVARINPDAYADSRARFHAYLVRAASKFTLGKLSGDEELLGGAKADAKSAHSLDAVGAPDGALFSPAFRKFYSENR